MKLPSLMSSGTTARREAPQVFAPNVIDVERPAGEVDAAQLGDEGKIGEAEQGGGLAVHEQAERHPEAALRPLAGGHRPISPAARSHAVAADPLADADAAVHQRDIDQVLLPRNALR